jgi:Zn ribbon nucleic-acid-binding protein
MPECVGYHPDRDRNARGNTGPRKRPSYAGRPWWCEYHQRQLRDIIGDLENLWQQLHLEARYGTPKTTAARTTRALSPSPAPAIDDADQLVRWLNDWDDHWRTRLNHPAAQPPPGSWASLKASSSYLHAHLGLILRHDIPQLGDNLLELTTPLPVLFGEELLATHLQLLKRTSRDRLIHRLNAPCPSCDMRALYREDGADGVDCGACERHWTEVEYQRLVYVLAEELRRAQPLRKTPHHQRSS